jgi:hypothetical protein
MLGFSVRAAPLTGVIKALSDSYVPAWWIAVTAIVLAVPLILTTQRPTPKQETASKPPPSP